MVVSGVRRRLWEEVGAGHKQPQCPERPIGKDGAMPMKRHTKMFAKPSSGSVATESAPHS